MPGGVPKCCLMAGYSWVLPLGPVIGKIVNPSVLSHRGIFNWATIDLLGGRLITPVLLGPAYTAWARGGLLVHSSMSRGSLSAERK